MCFSANASFVAAGITGAMGVASVTRSSRARELPLAAAPIIFGLQQCIEGLLWLNLMDSPEGRNSGGLTSLFLFFEEGFWPICVPKAVFLIEPNRERRRLLVGCLMLGLAVGAYLLWEISNGSHFATIRDNHIVYFTEQPQSNAVAIAYLASTALPLVPCSRRTVTIFG